MTLWYVAGAAVLLSIERLCYVWIWRHPGLFRELCGRLAAAPLRDPVAALRRLFVLFKLLQVGVFITWCLVFGGGALGTTSTVSALSALRAMSPDRIPAVVALGLLLLAAGQVLNAGVFVRLGQVGVFYGSKFGRSVPWCSGFPFSLCADPQYVGAVLSIWGFFLIARFPHDDWFILPVIETIYYVLGARLEREDVHESFRDQGAPAIPSRDRAQRPVPDC